MNTPNSSLIEMISTAPVLIGLNPPALALLASEGVVQTFLTDELILREGDAGHSLFILLQGVVEVVKHPSSIQAVRFGVLHSKDFFGEMSVVDPVARAATVRALTPVTAFEIEAGTLHHLYQQMPDQYAIVILNLARDLARRLRTLDEAYAVRAS